SRGRIECRRRGAAASTGADAALPERRSCRERRLPRHRRRRLLLLQPGTLRLLGGSSVVWLGMGAAPRPAPLAPLQLRALGLYRLRLDLGLLRALWLGDLSLRPLVLRPCLWLGVGPRLRLGPGLGGLAVWWRLHRLGATAARGRLDCRRGV